MGKITDKWISLNFGSFIVYLENTYVEKLLL